MPPRPKIPLGKISMKTHGHNNSLFSDETFISTSQPGPATYTPNKEVVMKNLGILAKLVQRNSLVRHDSPTKRG